MTILIQFNRTGTLQNDLAHITIVTTMVSEGKLRVVVGTRLEGLEALPDAYAGHGTARVAGKTVVEMHRE